MGQSLPAPEIVDSVHQRPLSNDERFLSVPIIELRVANRARVLVQALCILRLLWQHEVSPFRRRVPDAHFCGVFEFDAASTLAESAQAPFMEAPSIRLQARRPRFGAGWSWKRPCLHDVFIETPRRPLRPSERLRKQLSREVLVGDWPQEAIDRQRPDRGRSSV